MWFFGQRHTPAIGSWTNVSKATASLAASCKAPDALRAHHNTSLQSSSYALGTEPLALQSTTERWKVLEDKRVYPHWITLHCGKCKGRCLIRVLALVLPPLPCKFPCRVDLVRCCMGFHCAGSHKVNVCVCACVCVLGSFWSAAFYLYLKFPCQVALAKCCSIACTGSHKLCVRVLGSVGILPVNFCIPSVDPWWNFHFTLISLGPL